MRQRGVRTALTILGVVIGVISIVSLMAIGIGIKRELLSDMESTVNVTRIAVYGVSGGKRKDRMVTDRKLADMQAIEHVENVYPELELPAGMTYNRFDVYTPLVGVPESYLRTLSVKEGELPNPDAGKPELLMGYDVQDMFLKKGSYESYSDLYKEDEEKRNLTGRKMEKVFKEETDGVDKKDRFPIVGMLDGRDYQIYCNIDVLKQYLKRIAKNGIIPGQPTQENGENYREWIYNCAIVEVDDITHVETVMDALKDMGYQVENDKEYVDAMQKEIKIAQFLLGGIGMIALVVAVIGIGNTMTTSVYDRISEIGILRVLGCDTDDLLCLFLLESGILGGIGGLIGIVMSYGITGLCINKLAVRLLELPKGTTIAVIPLWLSSSAVVFSVILGILAGYVPARWASRWSPIRAVRSRGM
ncbi:MAG: ABC transporter permease [Lachnospiraceae bacterium]|nr:ABC transporter permease [Lachnospiraceae bacterium]